MLCAIISRAFAIWATRFKGFIEFPGCAPRACLPAQRDVVGTLETLFQNARKQFVDEIFFTTPCERGVVQDVLEQARVHGVDLRVVPDMYDGLAWNSPIEYIGQFPTIPLHRGHVPEIGLRAQAGLRHRSSPASCFLFSRPCCCSSPSPSSSIRPARSSTLRAHRQERPRLSLHQVPHHGSRCREAPRRMSCT